MQEGSTMRQGDAAVACAILERFFSPAYMLRPQGEAPPRSLKTMEHGAWPTRGP